MPQPAAKAVWQATVVIPTKAAATAALPLWIQSNSAVLPAKEAAPPMRVAGAMSGPQPKPAKPVGKAVWLAMVAAVTKAEVVTKAVAVAKAAAVAIREVEATRAAVAAKVAKAVVAANSSSTYAYKRNQVC